MFAPYKVEKPDAPVKADPFSLDALIAWLRTKPGEKTYCYFDTGQCLAAQYNQFVGAEYFVSPFDGEDRMTPMGALKLTFPQQLEWIAQIKERTFGAALDRALAIKARTP